MIVDQIIEETITDKTVETKGTGKEAQIKTTVGLGQDIEVTPEITLGMGPIIEAKARIEIDQEVGMKDKGPGEFQGTGIERIGPSSCVNTNRDRLRCFRCSEYDHFARECSNALTDDESGSGSEDLDDSTW